MAQELLLGIDLGTTVLKVCAFRARDGQLVARAERRLPVRVIENGGREQSLRAVDGQFRAAVGEVRAALGDDWAGVSGIGLAAQGGSSLIADRETGKVHTPMVLWNDVRAQAYTDTLAARIPKAYWRRHVLNDAPPAGLGRLHWLRERHSGLFTGQNIHIGAGEYLFHRLTGVWRQDAGNAIQIGSYNAAKQCLHRDPWHVAELPLSFVAPLRQGHELSPLSSSGARLLGLPEGIPVAGPYIDQEAGFMAASELSARPLQCSLGTAWVGNFALPEDCAGCSSNQLVLPSPLGHGRLVVLPLMAGNLTWDWALETFVNADGKKARTQAEALFKEALTPPEGLLSFPWFTLSNPVHAGAFGAGAFLGVNPSTNKADLLRAAAAGLSYEFARVFEQVKQNELIDCVVLGGGASQGAGFRSLLAALFAPLPVVWQRDADLAAARGAVHALQRKPLKTGGERVPVPVKAVRQSVARGYALYCAALDRVFPVPPGGSAYRVDMGKEKGR